MTQRPSDLQSTAPLRLGVAVGLVAAAMLMLEVVVTRLFSVLFYYHFSFFAISLVMSGLVVGGLVAARWNAAELSAGEFENRLAWLAMAFSAGTAVALTFILRGRFDNPSAPPRSSPPLWTRSCSYGGSWPGGRTWPWRLLAAEPGSARCMPSI